MSNFENSWYRPRIQFVMAFVSWCKAIYQCGITCLCDESEFEQLQQIAANIDNQPSLNTIQKWDCDIVVIQLH